jgi:hypothetical protein
MDMAGTIKTRREAKEWHERYDPLAPQEGDAAPDFELGDLGGQHRVRLSQFRGQKPVALVFGSFS